MTRFAVKAQNMRFEQNMDFFKNDKIKPTGLKFKCEPSTHIFLGQRIHFWGNFCDLTSKLQERGKNDPFLSKLDQNFLF